MKTLLTILLALIFVGCSNPASVLDGSGCFDTFLYETKAEDDLFKYKTVHGEFLSNLDFNLSKKREYIFCVNKDSTIRSVGWND